MRLLAGVMIGLGVAFCCVLVGMGIGVKARKVEDLPVVDSCTVRSVVLMPDGGAWIRLVPEAGRYNVDSSGLEDRRQ